MSRFYVKKEAIKDGRIFVGKEEAHHIRDVMRMKEGDRAAAFDGTGKEYHGIIENVSKRGLVIRIKKTQLRKSRRDFKVTLMQSLVRMDGMDYIAQKATELGISSIIPVRTERAVAELRKEKAASRYERWRRIVKEAAKQCGRADLADIEETLDFKEAAKKSSLFDLAIMPSVSLDKKASLKKTLSGFSGKTIAVFIGPEGGFTPSEAALARKSGVIIVSLGENVLRCETAAVAVLAMINYALLDI